MEYLKRAVETVLTIANKVVDAIADDGKVDWKEGIGISVSALGLIHVFKTMPEIKAELKKVNPENIQELVVLFQEKFDLPNDVAEQKIKDAVAAITALVAMALGK